MNDRLPDAWRELACEPPRALGGAAGTARIRIEPEDFRVEERLGFEPDGAGSHALLQVRKRLANTEWVARDLARTAGVRPFDVGFAGLKDRHAVTTQWFSVPLGRRSADSWSGHRGEGYEVLRASAHARKLPRGALAGNRFVLRLRDFDGDRERCAARLAAMAARGVPNWFGPQRFGHGLGNLRALLEADGRAPRGMPLSAARSLLFNAVLAARVRAGSWDTLCAGDLANLDGRNSVFAVTEVDATIRARVAALDLHPTGPLYGAGGPGPAGEVATLESAQLARWPVLTAAVEAARAEAARRPLRVALRDLQWAFDGDTLVLEFELRGGSFATAVLRECVDVAADEDANA